MKGIFLLVLIGMFSISAGESSELYWKQDYKLKVSDFITVKSLPKNKLATINAGLYLNRNYNGTFTFRVFAVCNKRASYMTEKVKSGYRLKEVLNHEQGHFDIAEYVARLCNSELMNIRDPQIAENMYHYYLDLLDDIQLTYDAQTEYSNDLEWQKKWDDKLEELLSPEGLSTNWKMSPYSSN